MDEHKLLLQDYMDSTLCKNNTKILSKDKYDQIVSALKSGDSGLSAKSKWTIKKKGYAHVNFPELNLNDVLCIPAKNQNENDPTIVNNNVQSRYEGIPRSIIQETCRTCPVCLTSSRQTNQAELKPILSSGFLTRAQIDLIDMRHTPDGEYNYIAHFMDHRSKFHIIWPLKRKTAEEVANGLNEKVFPYVGLPKILHSDNGREFVNKLVRELVRDWGGENDVLFINGRPRHSQSQGLVEQGNATIERHIANKRATLDLAGEEGYHWASWLPRIMFNMNTEMASGIKQMPYEVVYGQPLRNNIFPGATVDGNIINEEDLDIDVHETGPQEITATPPVCQSDMLTDRPVPAPRRKTTQSEPVREHPVPKPRQMNPPSSVPSDNMDSSPVVSPDNVEVREDVSSLEPQSNSPNAPDTLPGVPDELVQPTTAYSAPVTVSKHHQVRVEADKAYKRNAETMKNKYSKKKRTVCSTFEIGDMVTLRIPKIDRSGTDQPRLVCKVVNVQGKTDRMFKLQCEFGVIDGWYRSGDLMPFHQAYDREFSEEKRISVRAASLKLNPNMVTRKKCLCKQKCSKNCHCARNGLKCSSHCHPSRSCNNIETPVLNLEERQTVENNECLTDRQITAAQKMLKEQFPSNNGLHDTISSSTVRGEITPYLQIHHVNGNHWVTAVANTKDGVIELYDSLIQGKATSDTVNKLRTFHGCNAEVHTMNIQQQFGNTDCGLFAIANATSICHGDDPTAIEYIQDEMRDHFLSCVETGTLTMFPHQIKRGKFKRRVKYVQK